MTKAKPLPEAAVGIDIGGTKVLGAAPFAEGTPTERAATGPGMTPAALEAFIRRFVEGRPAGPLGIAVPGLLDEEGRVTACDVLPRLVGWRPADALADAGAPVCVLNDAEAALWAACENEPPGANADIVMAGTSVGAAFLVDGALLRGASRAAGELGYLPIQPDCGGEAAPLHECAGGAALAERLGTDGAGVARRAEAGDAEVLRAVAEAGRMLGLGLAAVLNLLNPSLLVVGGGTARLPGYYEAALKSAERHALPATWKTCTLRRAERSGVAKGAALYAAGRTPMR